jgi:O-acetylhomoserine/O-acetylserine sulfhydrylase-like pyridoxal-dependent enzyme
MSKEWLAEVKVGDTVYRNGGLNRSYHSTEVTKVTATQIVCGASRFRRSDGYAIGDTGYIRSRLVEPTKEVVEEHRAQVVETSLHNILRAKTDVALMLHLGEVLDAYYRENPKK